MKLLCLFVIIVLCLSDKLIKCSTNCSFTKSSETCLCIYKNDRTSVFPILYADCSRMGLKQLPKLSDAEDLDLSHNSIEVLDTLKTTFESNKLRSLRISYNRLNFIYQDFFKDIPNLISLDLSNNELVKFPNSLVFKGLTKLEVLNLSFNKISTLPENVFEDFKNLKELDLSYNYLGSLFSNNENLFKLNIGLNPTNITVLKLDGLGITNLSSNFFDDAINLRYLSLANNPLVNIPNVPNTLHYLDMSGADVTKVHSQEFTCASLKTLRLNKLAKLEIIEDTAFYNLKVLEELQLNDCKKLKQLNFLPTGTSEYSIKRLYMSRGGIRTVSSRYIDVFKSMEHVDLENNAWTCDCDVIWIYRLNITKNLRCASPNNLLNRKVSELTDKDLSSCFGSTNYYQTILVAVLCCLLGVLAALILYLVYLGPLYYKNQYRNIGPQSPYNGNTLRCAAAVDNSQ